MLIMKDIKMHKKLTLLISAMFLLFPVFSCNQGDVGMYYSLEVESEVQDSSLANDLSVGSMVRTGNYYYIAAGNMLRRGIDETDWLVVEPPASGMLCTEITVFEDTLYACWYATDGTSSGLYTFSADVWNAVGDMTSQFCSGLISLPSAAVPTLFIITRETNYLYTLWYKYEAQAPVSTTIQYSIPMTGAEWFDSQYYVIAGNRLYQGSAADSLVLSINTPALAVASRYNAISAATKPDSTELLFLSTSDGYIFVNDGNGWGAASTAVDTALYGFSRMSIEDTDGVIKTNLLIGSDSGYYELLLITDLDINAIALSKPGIQSLNTTGINYINTTLSDGVIRKFFYDNKDTPDVLGDDIVFALTSGQGLWINSGSIGARSWSIE